MTDYEKFKKLFDEMGIEYKELFDSIGYSDSLGCALVIKHDYGKAPYLDAIGIGGFIGILFDENKKFKKILIEE